MSVHEPQEDAFGFGSLAAGELSPWLSCHQQFRAWRDSGFWERINA